MKSQFIRRKNPEGYKELLVYKRAAELQDYVYQITENFPLTERRRREHMRDSSRSVKQNIVEGWKRETTQQYIDFLSFSFGSLGELKEDGEDCLRLGLFDGGERGERGERVFRELMRRCGEIDFLMGRLKGALERKVSKQDVLSPYQRWLGRKMEERARKERELDEELQKIIEGERKRKGEMGEKG